MVRESVRPRTPTPHPRRKVKRGFPEGSQLPRTPASSLGSRRGAIAASRGRDRFAPDSPHRQAGWPISTGRRRGQVFSLVSGALPESGAPRDAREARKERHFRAQSRLPISGGSVCAAREGRRLHLYRESTALGDGTGFEVADRVAIVLDLVQREELSAGHEAANRRSRRLGRLRPGRPRRRRRR